MKRFSIDTVDGTNIVVEADQLSDEGEFWVLRLDGGAAVAVIAKGNVQSIFSTEIVEPATET